MSSAVSTNSPSLSLAPPTAAAAAARNELGDARRVPRVVVGRLGLHPEEVAATGRVKAQRKHASAAALLHALKVCVAVKQNELALVGRRCRAPRSPLQLQQPAKRGKRNQLIETNTDTQTHTDTHKHTRAVSCNLPRALASMHYSPVVDQLNDARCAVCFETHLAIGSSFGHHSPRAK